MKPYKDRFITESLRIRSFSKKINPNDLVWHKDQHDRIITVQESKRWMIQFNNKLPEELKEGKKYFIPKNTWHRLVKGDSHLIILINEQLGRRKWAAFFGGGNTDPDDYSDEDGYDDYDLYDYYDDDYDDDDDGDFDESKIYEDVNMERSVKNPLFIFDFDDTLALTDSHVRVIRSTGKVDRLDSREFAKYRPSPGEMLDFSEFNRASGTLISSTVAEMENAIRKYGMKNVFIVTARAVGEPVSEFLTSMGVSSPTVVATAGSAGKGPWLKDKLLSGDFTEVHVYEDCNKNIQMLSDIVQEFNETARELGYPVVEYYSTCIVAEAVRNRIKQILLENIPSHEKLKISDSDIHGKGVFLNFDMPAGTNLGVAQEKTPDGYKISKLGKYHNHSYNPSCENKMIGNKRYLVTNKNLKAGDEVTVDYTFQPDLEQPKPDWI